MFSTHLEASLPHLPPDSCDPAPTPCHIQDMSAMAGQTPFALPHGMQAVHESQPK